MDGTKKVIYTVKKGYTELADFDNLEAATKFFAQLVQGPVKTLQKVEGKNGSAYYWKTGTEFTISSEELEIYQTEKEAKFAVYGGEQE